MSSGDGVSTVERRRMADAVKLMEKQHPGAKRYRAGLHGGDVYVEVWDDHGAAKIYMIKED